jgi:mRNA interferase MazF
VRQGEIWLMEAPDRKSRPALIVQRDAAIAVMDRVAVAPVTSTIRKLPTCVPLGPDEGLHANCVANFDSIAVVPKYALTRRLGDLGARHHEICTALKALADC